MMVVFGVWRIDYSSRDFFMNDLERLHNEGLKVLCDQVKHFYRLKKKFKIYHGSTNSTRTQKFEKNNLVDISSFNRVIIVNKEEGFAVVEPNVPMDRLVKETLKYGMVPPVVMEFPGITAGGGVQGGAGESSSFKWGGFHHICEEYEVVLGNGEIVNASKKQNPDLFWGTACSYGTLGIITKIRLKLISAKSFIKLKYQKVKSFEDMVILIEELTKTKADFIDGIMFSKSLGIIMAGEFSSGTKRYPLPAVERFSRAWDEWFYLHAEKVVKSQDAYEELVPLEDYLFRYNRGAFWVGKYAFTRSKMPFNRFTRLLFDPLLKTRTLYRFLQSINISQRQIVQDFILPIETVKDFIDYVDQETNIYPLWILPGNFATYEDKLSPGFIRTRLGIDVGVWGRPKIKLKVKSSKFKAARGRDYFYQLNRELEKKLKELGGRKVLYAHNYYPRDEFWEIYDEKWYRCLRKKYFAEDVFPDIYEKTFVKERYTVSFWKGLADVIKSPTRLPFN